MHDHLHEHGHGSHGSSLKSVLLINIAITCSEFIGGFMSGSLSLLSDASHNLSDVLAIFLSYTGERISEGKATQKHSYGMKRVGILTALVNSLTLIVLGIFILSEATKRFWDPEPVSLGIMLPVAFIGLLGNLGSILILRKEREGSLNVKAAFLHLFFDTLSSVAVILCAIGIYLTGWLFLDLAASVIIAVMMLWSGLDITKKAVAIFIESVPESIDFEDVHQSILKVKGVCSVHDLHIWSLSSSEAVLSCHLCMAKSQDSDKIINAVNRMLAKDYGISHTTIQPEKTNLCSNGVVCGL